MTKAEERAIALERRYGRLDAEARDMGHKPEPWTLADEEGAAIASSRCIHCLADAAVRIEGGGKEGLIEWEAGPLKFTACPERNDDV